MEITTLKRHAITEKHLQNVSLFKKTKPISKVFSLKPVKTSHSKKVKAAEIVLSGFFVENNISFRLVDKLISVLKNTLIPKY